MERQSQSKRVRDQLRRRIMHAELRPGEIIVESELAEQYHVSKTPVREALQTLAVEGLVTILSGKGYMIKSLNFYDIREIMDLRLIMEPPLLALAMVHETDELAVRLRNLLNQQFKPGATLDESLAAASGFHMACVNASRNNRAAAVVGALVNEVERLHHLMPVVEVHLHSDSEQKAHETIVAAVEQGDAMEAENRMREHLLESDRAIVKAFYEPGRASRPVLARDGV